MQEISAAVREGAQAYLKRQYTTIAVAGVVIFLIIGFLLGWLVALGFAILICLFYQPPTGAGLPHNLLGFWPSESRVRTLIDATRIAGAVLLAYLLLGLLDFLRRASNVARRAAAPVALAGVLVLVHMRRPGDHWMEGLIFVASLAIVWLGVALAH
jgi:K(+)-stimulated pyrophosphate-energized sodium pump